MYLSRGYGFNYVDIIRHSVETFIRSDLANKLSSLKRNIEHRFSIIVALQQ